MRPSTSAAAPPASLTSPKPGATKRQRRAAAVPLGEVTNLVLPETPAPSKPRRTARRVLPADSDASAVSSTGSSSALVTPAPKPSSSASATPAPKPSSNASATPAPKPSSKASATPAPKPRSAAIFEERSVVKSTTISTAYGTAEAHVRRMRRTTPTADNSKGKEPVGAAGTASCPPLGKSTRIIKKQGTRPISASAPCHETKKKRPVASTPKLPEDFVKKQRAYFAEIDAFEMAEEEVSESELE